MIKLFEKEKLFYLIQMENLFLFQAERRSTHDRNHGNLHNPAQDNL